MSNQHSTRPKDTHGSWVVRWTGKDNEVPVLESSNWAPGYTPAHCATQGEALAHAMAKATREIAIVRQKWIALTMILEQNKDELVGEMHNTISNMIADTPGVSTPSETKLRHRIYDTKEARAERVKQIAQGYNKDHDDEHGLEHLERIRDSYLGKVGGQVKGDAMQLAIDDWKARNQHPEDQQLVNDAGERWSQEEIDALEKSEAEYEEAERQRKGHPDYDPEEEWLPRD